MHPVFWLPLDFKFKSILPGLGGVYSPYRNMFWIKHQLPVSKKPLNLMSTLRFVPPLLRVKLISWVKIISLHSVSYKCITYFFLVYFLLFTAKTWAFLNFVDLFAKKQACHEKGCEREAKWHPLSQFKARYLVVYNLSMLVVCTMIRAFLVWRLSSNCSNADSVCLLGREVDRKAGRSGS